MALADASHAFFAEERAARVVKRRGLRILGVLLGGLSVGCAWIAGVSGDGTLVDANEGGTYAREDDAQLVHDRAAPPESDTGSAGDGADEDGDARTRDGSADTSTDAHAVADVGGDGRAPDAR